MTNEGYIKKRDEILAKLVSDITIAGYGKKEQPNTLIKKRDKQPFAGYEFCQDKAAQAIDALVLEVIGRNSEWNEYEDPGDSAVPNRERNILRAIVQGDKS